MLSCSEVIHPFSSRCGRHQLGCGALLGQDEAAGLTAAGTRGRGGSGRWGPALVPSKGPPGFLDPSQAAVAHGCPLLAGPHAGSYHTRCVFHPPYPDFMFSVRCSCRERYRGRCSGRCWASLAGSAAVRCWLPALRDRKKLTKRKEN